MKCLLPFHHLRNAPKYVAKANSAGVELIFHIDFFLSTLSTSSFSHKIFFFQTVSKARKKSEIEFFTSIRGISMCENEISTIREIFDMNV